MKLHVTKPALQTLLNALKRAPHSLREARDLVERGDVAQALQVCGNVMIAVGAASAGLYEGGDAAVADIRDAAKAVADKHSGGAS